MHYYKINNEIMQYSIFGNDIALIMHYRALFTIQTYLKNSQIREFQNIKVNMKLRISEDDSEVRGFIAVFLKGIKI